MDGGRDSNSFIIPISVQFVTHLWCAMGWVGHTPPTDLSLLSTLRLLWEANNNE
jgi:hypothetical protein